nr:hypothetical protein [Myxococcota bacterium]
MRIRALIAVSLAVAVALAAVVIDASQRREAARDGRALRTELAARTGLADLALSSGARWLRHPSQVEPAAAIADVPGALDVDPAGAWIGPPREVLR